MIRMTIPKLSIPTVKRMVPMTIATSTGIRRPAVRTVAVRKPIPRFINQQAAQRWHLANPKPGQVQNVINNLFGATPDDPIELPIKFGSVKVETGEATQNTLLIAAGIGLLGVAIYSATR